MATYINSDDEDIIYLGSEFKLNVYMEAIGSYHMDDVNFSCTFYTRGERVTLSKSDMKRVDKDNYVAPLDSNALGKGTLTVVYEADIPDNDFGDSYRHEVVVVKTELKIK